jgi:hypothetical protein
LHLVLSLVIAHGLYIPLLFLLDLSTYISNAARPEKIMLFAPEHFETHSFSIVFVRLCLPQVPFTILIQRKHKEVPKYLFYTYSDLAPLQSSDFTAFPNWSVIPTTAVTPFLLLFYVHEKFKLLSSVNNFKFNGIFNMFLDERFCSTVNKRSQK